jgi:hypothetical protein
VYLEKRLNGFPEKLLSANDISQVSSKVIIVSETLRFAFSVRIQDLLRHARMPEYLGAEPGITMVLHTWGQDLSFNPHVHCIVSAGGFDGKCWLDAKRKNNRFLFAQKSLANMFKAMFMEGLEKDSSINRCDDINAVLKAIQVQKVERLCQSPFWITG